MKELSIEEKAKRYELALGKVWKLYNEAKANEYNSDIEYYETIFPELKESEDEKIRRKLIKALKECGFTHFNEEFTVQEALAWLKKASQKDVQVILPTFTFDDILALQCCMKTVKEVQKDEELYNQLQSLHDRLHDAYWLKKQNSGDELQEYKRKLEKDISESTLFYCNSEHNTQVTRNSDLGAVGALINLKVSLGFSLSRWERLMYEGKCLPF